jgi:16S rRNA processing protein RimM
MDKNEHFYLGTISRKFSFKGEVVLQINPDLGYFPENLKSVFVEIQHKRIPFFIEFTKAHKKNNLRIKFEDISTEAEADNLVKRDVYVLKSEVDIDEEFSIKDLVSYTAFDDKDENEIGEIVNINTSTPQAFFEIIAENGQILIPVNEDWIIEIDEDHKEVYFELPEGLLDLNS